VEEEEQLVEEAIQSGLFGKGRAEREVKIGSKSIDVVFENENEIWIIEATRVLNYDTFGELLVKSDLYMSYHRPNKPVKLGILCIQSEPDIERSCHERDIRIFTIKKIPATPEAGKEPVCGICGTIMRKTGEDYSCPTCEHFFGNSSIVKKCERCGQLYGSFPALERYVRAYHGDWYEKAYWGRNICPTCRRNFYQRKEGTLAELIREDINSRDATVYELEIRFVWPRDFINWCLGKVKLNL